MVANCVKKYDLNKSTKNVVDNFKNNQKSGALKNLDESFLDLKPNSEDLKVIIP